MLNATEAKTLILAEAEPLSTEVINLRKALHRVLAKDITADINLPPFDNSAMDGYAVRSSDVKRASNRHAALLAVAGEASAGNIFGRKISNGEAVRIMTGGKIPDGADAVIPVEEVSSEGNSVMIRRPIRKGEHIRRSGDDIAQGEKVLGAGEMLTPARMALLASLGFYKVEVYRKPRVAILATGDELVRVGSSLKDGQIRNSNSLMLAAYVEQCGGDPVMRGIVPDNKKLLLKKIKNSFYCDMLLITGGVSVGKYDYVKEILSEAGVDMKFWRANIKPGKPIVFGKKAKTLVFGLPGNPASAGVTFLQFVKPALERTAGRLPEAPLVQYAICDEDISKKDGKRHYVRGYAYLKNQLLHVTKSGNQSSGALSAMARANCLIVLPENTTAAKRGRKVQIELI